MLGGVSTAVSTLRRSLEALGHETVVVAPRMAGARAAEDGVVRVPAIPAPTYPDFALPVPGLGPVARMLRGLDVVHAHHPFLLGGTARRLARALDRPLVFTHHTLYDKYAHYVPLPRAAVARAAVTWSVRFANTADLVVAPSEFLAERLRIQGVRRPVAVVPTGIDLETFQPGDRQAARTAVGIGGAERLLLYVGRLDREKNLGLLLDVLASLSDPSVRLVLVGRGTQEGELRAAVTARGLGRRVLFRGGMSRGTLAPYYQAADVFVFASTTETQGLAVLEAMASGLPVVAVRAGGVEEAVADGVSGLLVPEDAPAFGNAVQQLLADPGLAAKLATGGREAATRFAAPALARRMADLYRRLVDGRPRRPATV
jgi:glycosyltransferase involved in cell wall biosynthesis